MSFIVEILPTKVDGSKYVYVVRQPNGYPLSVCDTLEDATAEMQLQFEKMMQANSPKS